MTTEQEKRAAARAALRYVIEGGTIGVGSGTTAAHFVRALAAGGPRVAAAVAASAVTGGLLRAAGIRVVELEHAGRIPVYVDGADEITDDFSMIKGGGGAHTMEKRIATASDRFVCIVDASKPVLALGFRPVPVEVEVERRVSVERELRTMGGIPRLREGFVTDLGGEVLDVDGLDLTDPAATELRLETIPGVVSCGIFAVRRADVMIVGEADGSVTVREREA